MKKIYSFVFAAVALFAAASCQKELVNAPETKGEPFSFTATIGADTKTALSGEKAVVWTPGDKVDVFNADGTTAEFTTDITEASATATFTGTLTPDYTASNLYAIYPTRGKNAKYDKETGIISSIRIAGSQKAVAGSFDKEYAVAVGSAALAPAPEFTFKSVHALFKFTVDGEAPTTVTVANKGMAMIAGSANYDVNAGTTTVTGGAGSVTLTGPFESGKTYYVATYAFNTPGVSISFDGVELKTALPKDGAETFRVEANKIYDFGTLKAPEKTFNATEVMKKQSVGSDSYMAEFGGTPNTDRNMAIDDEYVYIAETQASPVLWKIALADGTATKMPVGTVDGGGTFALACPRVIKNTDANLNGGKDVLAVCNMGQGTAVYLYLYTNGIDADPAKISMHFDGLGRRLGDQFSVSGTLQNGYVWFKEQGSNAVMNNVLPFTSENIEKYKAEGIWPDRVMLSGSDAARGSLYFYPGADLTNALYTSTAASAFTVRDDETLTANKPTYIEQTWAEGVDYSGCHGFNFFKLGGKDYIAYTNFANKTLYVIKGAASAEGVKAALEAKDVVWSAAINASTNGCGSGNSGADCAVRVIDDNNVYVAGHIQNVGVVVYKLSAE